VEYWSGIPSQHTATPENKGLIWDSVWKWSFCLYKITVVKEQTASYETFICPRKYFEINHIFEGSDVIVKK